MAQVICQFTCDDEGKIEADSQASITRVGQICEIQSKPVPCGDNGVVPKPVCGFYTSWGVIKEKSIKCSSTQQETTCSTDSGQQFACIVFVQNPDLPATSKSSDVISTSTSRRTEATEATSTLSTVSSRLTTSATTDGSPSTTVDIQSQLDQKSQGIPDGAAVGIGIGSAITGAAIAALVLLLFFGRYKKRHQKSAGYSNHLPNYNSDLGRHEKELPTPTKTGVVVTESYLPQPAEDDAIIGEFSKVRDNIKNHVQSFYITGPIDPQSLNRGVLREVSRDAGIQFSKLQDLLVNRTSRNSALRLCIGWMILSRCDGKGPVDTSLLPDEAAAVAALMSDIDYTDARTAILASKLKVISGALLQSRSGQPQPPQSAKLEHRIEQALLSVNDFLTPFIESSIDATTDKRIRNLESIVRRASQLALLLFSQPSSWALDFGNSGTGQQGTIVVFPGLLETVSEEGVIRQPPRQFRQPEVTAAV